MALEKQTDVFITHAWRNHADWRKMIELLDSHDDFAWRNFSLPWHDPAFRPSTEFGGQFVRKELQVQILPSKVVILLAGVYAHKSSQKWINYEVELAREYDKPVIAVPKVGEDEVPDEVREMADEVCAWDAGQLVEAIRRVAG